MDKDRPTIIDFGPVQDMTKNLIKVVGVGGGGCNAVNNMYTEGIKDVSFAVCNTDSQSLSRSPVKVKIPLGKSGLGAGAVPERGRKEAEDSIDSIKKMLSDGTQMVFVTAGMGGGTGTGAAPVVAGVAKEMGLLTIGIVTIPFYFEKEKKIIKALKGVEEMRRNVDSLLIINNERICDIYSNSHIPVKEAFRQADNILNNAVKSISELITLEGGINLDFRDVESTMKSGGGAIMAIGRAGGEHRVQKAILDALDSPLLYGSDINRAKRILFNIYASSEHPLFVDELGEIDAFMDELDPQIDVIWGISDDESLGEDAKIAILATGVDGEDNAFSRNGASTEAQDAEYYRSLIKKLYIETPMQQAPQPADKDVVLIINEGKNDDDNMEHDTSEPAAETKTESETKTGGNDESQEERRIEPEEPPHSQEEPEPNPFRKSDMTFLERLKTRIKDTIDKTLYE